MQAILEIRIADAIRLSVVYTIEKRMNFVRMRWKYVFRHICRYSICTMY